jgi:GNAT superfamily N-acetyltransferase
MLKVSWHTSVTAEVEEALFVLPECETCPHDLYRKLLTLPRHEPMRIAVVREAGQPIAVAGTLPRSRLSADSLTNWLFPGTAFPVLSSRRLAALKALGREVHLSWWRMGEPVPNDPAVADVDIKPTYRMEDISRREEFWRSTDLRRKIKNIRNRTTRLRVEVGNLSHVAPIVAGWHAKWTGGDPGDAIVRARIAIAHALEGEGRHITLALLDGDEIAAGSTNFVHRGELVAGVSYMSDNYRQLGVGVRMIDAMFDEAGRRGIKAFDLGGGGDYKQKWAPIGGERAKFSVASPALRMMRRMTHIVKSAVPRGRSGWSGTSPCLISGLIEELPLSAAEMAVRHSSLIA